MILEKVSPAIKNVEQYPRKTTIKVADANNKNIYSAWLAWDLGVIEWVGFYI